VDTFFLVCAALGGTVLLLQLVAGLVGLGGDHSLDHDSDHDHGHDAGHSASWYAGMLSVRALTAALTFFGLGGLTAYYYGATDPAATAALYAVATLMRLLHRLRSDGTARVERAVGRTGSVYLRVPGGRAGVGKVHLNLQNRTVEYQAVTAGAELPTGAVVRVVSVLTADTVEVEAIPVPTPV
jgi:hypothetical protein